MQENNDNAPTPGIVYVLTNEGMPNLVKIGRTTNLPARLNALFSSSVPFPFVLHHAVEVTNAKGVERRLFEVFGDKRVNNRREFFRVEPERVVAAIGLSGERLLQVVDKNHKVGDGVDDTPLDSSTVITEDDIKAGDKQVRRRAKNFRFDVLGIPKGAELTFSRDAEVTAEVVDGKNKVKFQGETMSISKAADIVLQRDFQWSETTTANGAWYWEYQGEILNAIRTRKEEDADDENEGDS